MRERPIVLVVHGPEIFDAGEVAWLIERIRPDRSIVAGVMARTAAEESGLPVEFSGLPPSRIIRSLNGPVLLANHAKTPESGRIFGSIVASRLDDKALIQVECADRAVIVWNSGDRHLAAAISRQTGFPVSFLSCPTDHKGDERRIRGCLPGEPVYVNGIVIGKAAQETVVLRSGRDGIEVVSGLIPKPHGLEKLARPGGVPELSSAWCKSGSIRSGLPGGGSRKAPSWGRIVVIDHCGHEIYNRIGPDCCGVLAIGDDTTAVCGHICAHRGIPVLGIIDGDRDAILPSAFAPGSVVCEALGERDDDVGKEVAGMAGDGPADWSAWVASVVAALGSRIRIAVDTRDPSR